GLVVVAETEFQDVPGHLGGELAAFVAENASEDRHLVFAGISRSSAHVHSSVCMVYLAYHIRRILPRLTRCAAGHIHMTPGGVLVVACFDTAKGCYSFSQ